jgi:branched-chain amino acid transport system substrate-binding protein
MKKAFFAFLALILVFGMVLTGCGEEEETPVEIRVGAIASMTGMNAMTGAEHRWAYEVAVRDINAAGGVYVDEYGTSLPLRLIFADDQSTAAEGAAAAERLIRNDKVDLLVGTNITPINIAAATVAEKYEVYMACCVTWLDQFAEQEFTWATDMFTSTSAAAEVPFQILDLQSEAERPARIGMMMEDNPDGQGFGDGFRMMSAEYGYDIVVDEAYVPGTKDFSSSILKIKNADCDALLWLGSPTDSIVLIRQLKEQQVDLKYIHGFKGFWPTEFVEGLGDDANYIVHDGFWAETLPYPGAAELGQDFKDDYSGKDTVSAGLPYANIQILAEAIERAGTLDPGKVRDEVFNGTFAGTVMGDITFENGQAFTPLLGLQWIDGNRIPVYPPEFDLEWAPPWSER